MRWHILIEEYGANFVYKKRTENIVANTLSRVPTSRRERNLFQAPEETLKNTILETQSNLFETLMEYPEKIIKENDLFIKFLHFDQAGRHPFHFETISLYQTHDINTKEKLFN